MPLTVGPQSLQRLNRLLDVPRVLQEVEVVEGYRQFKDDPDNPTDLPPEQRPKITSAAIKILQTLDTPLPAVGVVIRGHADQDLTKVGEARTRFELDISRRRARLVRRKLQTELDIRAPLLTPGPAQVRFILMQVRDEGRGAKNLVFPPRAKPPLTERERSLNRRVQILVGRDFPSIGVVFMFCGHGGRLIPTKPVPLETDDFLVLGCGLITSAGPSPCVVGRFFGIPDGVVSRNSLGFTFNAAGILQGPIVIV